jgi:hypothetical protein
MRSKKMARLLALSATAAVAVALAAPAAQGATPKPGYTQFAGCPSKEEIPSVFLCVRSVVSSGNFKMGNKDVPITNPIILSGGFIEDPSGEFAYVAANAKGGMSKSPQKVPGGVVGLTGLTWLLEFLGSEALTLYATTELVGVPTVTGPLNLNLPVRVHLENGVLGKNCYVGSPTSPISLHLINGTTSPPLPNKPITGILPKDTEDASTGIITQTGGRYVDNSFSAPGASGCVLTLFGFIPISINGLVNSSSGLPAAAGTNETKQNYDSELASREAVYGP